MTDVDNTILPYHLNIRGRLDRRFLMSAAITAALAGTAYAQEQPVQGVNGAHDPSTITKVGSNYYYYVTGQEIVSRNSTDLINWNNGPTVFSTQPSWTSTAVPGFTGNFWAPDVTYLNGQYNMYYAVSTFGSQVSAIGLATNPTLNPSAPGYAWTDQGPVIQSNASTGYNTIDPSILQDSDGSEWMSFGSYFNGIYLAQLNPTTGKLLNSTTVQIATNYGGNSNNYFDGIEASYLMKHDGYYYLFENWGSCCSGVSSTYNIRVGRSTSVSGPFVDENGVSLDKSGSGRGGTLFLGNNGNEFGPGQFSFFNLNGQDQFGYHYYDGNFNGAPTEGIRDLFWTANDWPTIAAINPGWTGTTDGNWSTAANWPNGGANTVPNAAGSIANFGTTTGQHTVTLDGGAKTVATVNFNSSTSYTIGSTSGNGLILDSGIAGSIATDSATINVQLGSHSILAPITANENLGVNITPSTSILTLGAVSGSVLTEYGLGTLKLTGTNTYTGNVFVHGGTLTITGAVSTGAFNSIGIGAGDVGTLSVGGSGSFTTSADLNIADTGVSNSAATGTLDLSGTAQVTINSGGGFFVGSGYFANTKSTGTVTQSGGTLTANGNFDGAFIIGGRSSSLAVGTYNLSGGTVNANTDVWDGGYGKGTVTQTAGTFQAADGLAIGRETGSTGIWNISGGALNQTTSSTTFAVGQSGAGTLTISGTGLVTAVSALKLGLSGGTGVVNLTGGTLMVPAIQQGTGTGFVNFSGGTLEAAVNSTAFLATAITAKVKIGGADINSNGFNVTISTALPHDSTLGATADGGLTKTGLGTLTLQGVNTYTGATTISGGTLALASNGSLTSSSVTVANQATLTAGGAINDGLATNTALNVRGTATVAAGASGGGITTPTLSSLTLNTGGAVQLSSPASHADRQVLITGALTFGNTNSLWQGSLDLTANDMIVRGGNVANIQSQLAAGHNTGSGYWNGPAGILSSTAASDSQFLTALGYKQSGGTPFDGVTTTTADVLVKYTYYGDANLDGAVDGADYQQIDNGFGSGLTGWSNGDFNYDGVVDGSDFSLIDNTFNQLTATGYTPLSIVAHSAAISSVPEPTTLGLLSLGAIGLLTHRRRRNR